MNRWVIILGFLFVSCKPITLGNTHQVLFSKILKVATYEYNAHTLDIEGIFFCTHPYCTDVLIANPHVSKKAFDELGWTSEVLRSFLASESYEPYEKQSQFHIMIFLFQSDGVDYVRVVNGFTKKVTTTAFKAGSKVNLEDLLASQNILYVHSKPTLADVYIGSQKTTEAPVWLSLNKGKYEIQCKLPSRKSPPEKIHIPGPVMYLCEF